jgi:two-component system, LuxR family, response regulator FixJ
MENNMLPTPTVSIVDDDEQVRESLATLIQSMNLDVQCYASGREFLDDYSDDRGGCVVLDLRMPQLSGLDVIEEMNARNIEVPVIMISGHGDIPAAVAAIKAGAVDFLEKPYRGAALIDCVHKAIERDAKAREARAAKAQLIERYESLTDDEKQVLELTVAGKPDKAIALKLDLSLRTIQLRRASVMRKMHTHSRAALIGLAHQLDLTAAAT